MSQYRYKKASINAPAFAGRWIEVKRISDGILSLNAMGDGFLKLHTGGLRTKSFRCSPEPAIHIDRLRNLDQDQIYKLFDQAVDIALGRQEICTTAHHCSWPDDLKTLAEESKWRLAHFAGILIAKCGNVTWQKDRFFGHVEPSMVGAELTEEEIRIARGMIETDRVDQLLGMREKQF